LLAAAEEDRKIAKLECKAWSDAFLAETGRAAEASDKAGVPCWVKMSKLTKSIAKSQEKLRVLFGTPSIAAPV
jgi:hypothetical protein